MADSFSVRAILSATDSGFSSTLKSCSSVLDKLGNKVSGFSFGLLTGAGQAAFSSISNGVKDLVGEIDSSNKAWKTFEGNMKILGKTEDEIKSVKGTLQKYATETIYSASDMASSYAQLEAVGIKSADKLITGFGGLAAAAENPSQAMKTLSQQGVQMAAKPTVAWQDFKLMLEQTPAGMARVAKAMGMTSTELVTAVQDGTVATEDFFAAVSEVGNVEFGDLARQYKSVGDAADGLKETLSNKLQPAFDMVSQKGITAISGVIDKLDGINADGITKTVSSLIDRVTEFGKKAMLYIDAAKEAFDGVGTAVGDACSAVRESFNEAFGSTESVDGFKGVMEGVADVIKKVADFATEHSDEIATLVMNLPKIAIALKGFQVAKTVAPFVTEFATGIGSLAGKGIGGIASKLFGISKSQTQVGTTSQVSGAQMLTAAKSYALMGVAVLTIAAGFALLAQSSIALANAGGLAIGVMAGMVLAVAGIGVGMALLLKTLAPMSKQLMPVATAFLAMGAAVLLISAGFALLTVSAIALANAGGGAIAVMVGMVAVIALLAVGAAALGTALTAGAVGFIAFGAALALVGVAAVLAAAALAIISAVLPTIAEYGLSGAGAIAALGASMLVFAVGAAAAGVAAVALGAGLVVAAVGIAAVAVGVAALGVGILVLAAGVLVAAAAMALFAGVLPTIATYGTQGAVAIVALGAAMLVLSAGALAAGAGLLVLAAGTLAADVAIIAFGVSMAAAAVGVAALAVALLAVTAEMKSIASNAKKAESSLDSMQDSISVVESGLSAIGSKAKSAMNSLKSAFDDTASKAKSAGEKTGSGFANGMKSGLTSATNNTKAAGLQIIAAMTATASQASASGSLVGMGFAIGVQGGMAVAVATASSGSVLVAARLRSGYSGAYSAGAYISLGFAAGMRSQLGAIQSAAAAMAAAADKAVRAKAKIHSPSKVSTKDGRFWGLGLANGIEDTESRVRKAAENLVALPEIATHNLSGTYSGEISADYDYYRNAEYVIVVPLDIDGREFARATVKYSQEELDRRQTRENRKSGKV